jgi:predicted nucleic acid-binding protein
MSAVDFLALDASSGAKGIVARGILESALSEGNAILSFQVVQETLHVIGRKFRRAAEPVDRAAFLAEVLAPLWRVQPSVALYGRATEIEERYGLSFYDSLVVAAALEGGCARLLSEDLQHGQEIDGLRIENPFRAAPKRGPAK